MQYYTPIHIMPNMLFQYLLSNQNSVFYANPFSFRYQIVFPIPKRLENSSPVALQQKTCMCIKMLLLQYSDSVIHTIMVAQDVH